MWVCAEELARLQRKGQQCHRRAEREETELASTLIMFTTKGQGPVQMKEKHFRIRGLIEVWLFLIFF